jgi:hypothetical protein
MRFRRNFEVGIFHKFF